MLWVSWVFLVMPVLRHATSPLPIYQTILHKRSLLAKEQVKRILYLVDLTPFDASLFSSSTCLLSFRLSFKIEEKSLLK